MNGNLKRVLDGWHPRRNARWYWWVMADARRMMSLLKVWGWRWVERWVQKVKGRW